MESHADLTRVSTIKLKNELSRQEKRLGAVLTAFPYLENGTASLSAQYVGGPEWKERTDAKKRITEIKLELIRRGKWNAYVNSAGSEIESASETILLSRKRSNAPTPSKKGDPDVAKRRAIVRSNHSATAGELCQIFDRQSVPVPFKWKDAGFGDWTKAYKQPSYRRRIDVMVSKDKGRT